MVIRSSVFGGCAALAGDLDRLIRKPWRDVRRSVVGSADERLHAHSFARTARPRDMEAVAQFFRDPAVCAPRRDYLRQSQSR